MADIIQWDVGTWKYGLSFWAEKAGIEAGCSALDIGGRDGGLSLFLALNGCRVVCSDLDGPTARARELHRAYGVYDLVSYAEVDATMIPYPDERFDLVVLKSVLGALGDAGEVLAPQRRAIGEIRRVLKPGGRFLLAENMRGSSMHRLLRARYVPWGRRWHYFSTEEVEDLLSPFAAAELSFRGFAATLGRQEWQRRLLHGLDRLIVPLTPVSSRYVVFGVAVK